MSLCLCILRLFRRFRQETTLFTGPVETKVQTTSVMTLVGSVGLAVLNAVAGHSSLLGSLPSLAQFVILAAIPPVTTFLTGYVSPATARPDLWEIAGPANPWSPPLPTSAHPTDAPPLQHPPYQDDPYPPYQNSYEQGRHRR